MKINVLILCGGKGSRLKKLFPNTPKPLVKIKNKIFLDIILDFLHKFNLKNIYLSLGNLSSYYLNQYNSNNKYELKFIIEDSKLDTGGAIKKAFKEINTDKLIVLNGDSFCNINLTDLINFHNEKKSQLTIVATKNLESRDDVGSISINNDSLIIQFSEKLGKGNLINAGIYIISKKILSDTPAIFSIEKDFFPRIINNKNCYAYVTNEALFDIGTPERYEYFKSIFNN